MADQQESDREASQGRGSAEEEPSSSDESSSEYESPEVSPIRKKIRTEEEVDPTWGPERPLTQSSRTECPLDDTETQRRDVSIYTYNTTSCASRKCTPNGSSCSRQIPVVPMRLTFGDEVEESAQASGPTPSTSAPSSKKPDLKRGQHGRHQVSKKVHQILKIGPDGQPLEPETIIGTFSNQVACIAKEKVPITYENWRHVPMELKQAVWDAVKARFNYPLDQFDENLCKKHALIIASKALRGLRSRLNTEYVKQNKLPFEDYNFIKRHQWDEFVERVTSEDFCTKSDKFKELAKKNELKHNLGMTGYAGKRKKFRQKETEAAEKGEKDALQGLDLRSRDFFHARVPTKPKPGSQIKYNDPKVDELEKKVLAVNEAKNRGDFQPRREHDVLTEALGRPEHRGRVRGLGSRQSWKSVESWQSDANTYHTRQRYKDALRKQGYEEALKEMINKQIAEALTSKDPKLVEQRNIMFRQSGIQPAAQPLPQSPRASSCPVDNLQENFSACDLLVPLGRRNRVVVGEGIVHRPEEGATFNNEPIPPGYVVVTVSDSRKEFGDYEIDIPGLGGERFMREVCRGCGFILWNKEDIRLKSTPQTAEPDRPGPSPPHGDDDDDDNGGNDDWDDIAGIGGTSPQRSPPPDTGNPQGGTGESSPAYSTTPSKKPIEAQE